MRKLEGLDLVREKIRIRDSHTCQKCYKVWQEGQRRFDVHHLDEYMESQKDYAFDKNNAHRIITFCHKCHINLHSVKWKMRRKITPDILRKIRRLRDYEDFTYREIGEQLDISYLTVRWAYIKY